MNFEAWVPLTLVFAVVAGFALWHLVTHDVPYMPKWAWALLVIFTFPIGSFIYIAVVIFGAGTHREDAEGRSINR
ncbi:MAG: PLDc N-terminal domain-containing protein [Actinomycetota bacterium]